MVENSWRWWAQSPDGFMKEPDPVVVPRELPRKPIVPRGKPSLLNWRGEKKWWEIWKGWAFNSFVRKVGIKIGGCGWGSGCLCESWIEGVVWAVGIVNSFGAENVKSNQMRMKWNSQSCQKKQTSNPKPVPPFMFNINNRNIRCHHICGWNLHQ